MIGWPRVALRDLGRWYGGGTPSKANPAFWENGHVPWLSPKDMGDAVISETRDHISEDAVSASAVKLVPPGSVAIVVRSGILERTLPVAVVPFETTLNQDMKAVAPREDVDPRWIAWGIRAFEAEILGATRKRGTTVASLEMPRLLEWRIPLPPLEHQREVLDLLEDHISRLDAAGRELKRVYGLAGGLLARSLADLFENVEGRRLLLGDVAAWGSGGTPRAGTTAYYEGGTIPWVNSGDLRDEALQDTPRHITEEGLRNSSAKWVPPGSVLVAMYGATIGRTALTTKAVTTNQAIAFAKPDSSVIGADFLFWFVRSQAARLSSAGQGGAQPNISQTVLKNWPINVPDLSDQARIVRAAHELDLQTKRLRSGLHDLGHRQEILRGSLLRAAFSGRLTSSTHDDLEIA